MTVLTWPFRMVGFACWFLLQVVISNVTVLRDNLSPGQNSTPGVVSLATRCRTDTELTVLASLITLTPGTLTLGTSEPSEPGGARVLHVHGMYHTSADSLRDELLTIERRMLDALRREGGHA